MVERDYSGDVLPPNNLPAVAQEYLRALEKRIGIADSRARRASGNLGGISSTQQATLEQLAQERAERESATSDIVGAGPTKAPSTPLVFSAKGNIVVHWDGKAYDDTPMPTSLAFTVPQYSLTEPPAYEPPPPADPVTGQEPSPPSDSVVWQPVGQPLRAAGDAAIPDIPTGTRIWVRLQAYTLGGVASYPSDWVAAEVESIAAADLDPEVMDRIEAAEAAQADLDLRLDDADGQLQDARDRLAAAEQELLATIVSSLDEYTVTTSQTTPPGPDAVWSSDTPDYTPGTEFVWRRVRNVHTDGSVTYGAPVVITGADGAPGEDATLLRIYSSRGTSFKNNAISTVLTVTVFKGSQQITNITDLHEAFGPTAYLEWYWRRLSDSEWGLISSADPRLSQGGFALTVSPDDVDEQTTFECTLQTP